MATNTRYVELAKQLHPRLQRFFAKYPPTQILPASTRTNTIKDGATPNPFLPHKHPVTGKWHNPEFSLRRQAELVKLAREQGVEELLPFTSKGTEERIRTRVEEGLRVRGTGVDQSVKGHLHERMLATKYVDGEEKNCHAGHAETRQAVAENIEEKMELISAMSNYVMILMILMILWRHRITSILNCIKFMYHSIREHRAHAPGIQKISFSTMARTPLSHRFRRVCPKYQYQKDTHLTTEPTLYDILALTPKHLEGQAGPAQQQKVVKQAYHRALLKYHPDKAASNNSSGNSQDTSSPSSSSLPNFSNPTNQHASQSQQRTHGILYTVDQIQHAYTVLSDSRQRAEYNRSLQRHAASSSQHSHHGFQTGVETVDLDDLGFDDHAGIYYRSCRCGNARGYAFTEDNLEEFEADGVLMVECRDCSLWLRVLFAAAADDDDEDSGIDDTIATHGDDVAARRSGEAGAGEEVISAGESQGGGTGRGFRFSWSFDWGISLSGSAAAETGSSRS
ncbi:hypothetical protein AAE478_000769 [Parahypoxylon ruwenzoriense]